MTGRKLIDYLQLARISNLPTVVTNVLAGSALAGILIPNATVWLVCLAMLAFYAAGMYLNDICDINYDKKHKPSRPLVRGTISKTTAIIITIILFGIGIIILGSINRIVLQTGLLLVFCIVVYNFWHKTNPLSPVIMALCRCLVYITAFSAFSTSVTPLFAFATIALGIYLIVLTFLAKKKFPIMNLLAGISLFDGIFLLLVGSFVSVAVAIFSFFLTRFLNQYIKGT